MHLLISTGKLEHRRIHRKHTESSMQVPSRVFFVISFYENRIQHIKTTQRWELPPLPVYEHQVYQKSEQKVPTCRCEMNVAM